MRTWWLAPPCLKPFKEPTAAPMAEYISVPALVSTRVVKVELLPPPCSAWSTMSKSSSFASWWVNFLSGRRAFKMASAVAWSGS